MGAILNRKQACLALLILACCVMPLALKAQEKKPARRRQGKGIWHEYPAAQVARGRIQFRKTCAFCHGPDANGGSVGPDLMRSAVVRDDHHGNLIGKVVRTGFPDKGMPSFNLSSAQIIDIVAFLRYRLNQSDRRSAARVGASYSLAKLLVGNAKAGKAFFDGAGKCSSCHSPTGDLKGIAKKIPPADLQADFLYPSNVHATATVTLASGRQYTGRIRLLTRYDIAIVDGAGWYRSWPIHSVKVQIHDPLAAHRKLLFKFTDADMHNVFAYLETLK